MRNNNSTNLGSNYNVFISYKATDDNGRATKDAIIAEKLYNQLSVQKGIVPFWDKRELTNFDGRSDYSNSIYSALESAKVFIFICTKAEYLLTDYVESEWSTYLTELNSGRKPRGSIYGITFNVDYDELPIGLRKYETLPYSEENLEFITYFIRKRLQDTTNYDNELSIQNWTKQRKELLLNRLVFSDFNVRQFVDSFLNQQEKYIACVSSDNDYENNTSLAAEAIRLFNSYNVYYFFSIDEACQTLKRIEKENLGTPEGNNIVVFVEESISTHCFKRTIDLFTIYNYRFVLQTKDNLPPYLKTGLYYTNINSQNEHELLVTLKAICQEKSMPYAGKFISMLRLPNNKALMKPTYICLMIDYLTKYGDSISDSSSLDLFAIFDSAIISLNNDVALLFNQLIDEYINKQINSFSEGSYSQYKALIQKLTTIGVIDSHLGRFAIKIEDYLYYKVATFVLIEHGKHGLEFLKTKRLFQSIPHFLFILSLYDDILSDFDGLVIPEDEEIKLLFFFIQSSNFYNVVNALNSDQLLSKTLFYLLNDGLYDIVQNALKQLENFNAAYKTKSWVKVIHMALDYYQQGRFIDCNCSDDIWYWIYKGTFLYYLDDYENAVSSLEHALSATDSEEQIIYIIMTLADVLVDSGRTNILNNILSKYQCLFSSFINNIHYCIYKGNISFNQGDLLDAKEYYSEALTKLKKHFNSADIARIYGNIGLVDYYLGNTDIARKLFLKNEDICIDTNNTNGIAISRVYLGKTHLYTFDYQRAFNCFSAALFYATKAQNQWRIIQISILIDQFYQDFEKRIGNHIVKIESIPSPVYHAEMFLMLAECMLRTNCPKDKIVSVLKKSYDASTNSSAFFGQIATYYLSLLNGTETSIPMGLNQYCFYSKKLYDNYTTGTKLSIDFSHSILPFVYYKELSSARLQFCHVSKEHAAGMFLYASRIQPTKYVLWAKHESIFTTMNYIEELHHCETQYDDYMAWTIVENDSGNVIGMVDLRYDEDYKGVEIGIILSDFYWHRGFGTETISRISRFANEELHLKELYGVCVNGNSASEHLLQKCGFVFVKTIPNYHNIDFLSNRDGLMFKKNLND